MKKVLVFGLFSLLIVVLPFKLLKSNTISPKTESSCESKLTLLATKTAEKYIGEIKAVDFSSFPETKTYYTRITEAVKRGVNFSDHYILIPIGCGTDCVLFAVVDAKTGKVIAYDSGRANYHLENKGSYLVLEPVFAGQTREFKKVDENNQLQVVCTETATKDYYQPTE